MRPSTASPERPDTRVWLAIFAGLCASLVSIVLARFAYTPLIPALIQAQWFSIHDVVYLGAANLVGYLIGALLDRPLALRLSRRSARRTDRHPSGAVGAGNHPWLAGHFAFVAGAGTAASCGEQSCCAQ